MNISPQREITLKGVLENLSNSEIEIFLKILHKKSSQQLKLWINSTKNIEVDSLTLYKN